MLSQRWKSELVWRSTVVSKIFSDHGIANTLVGIGGVGIEFEVQTAQDIDDIMRSLFRKWPDVVGVQVIRSDSRCRVIHLTFNVLEIDSNAQVGSEDDFFDQDA